MESTRGVEKEGCPSDETLAAFLDGRASRRERRELTAHLDACPRCRTIFVYSAQYHDRHERPIEPEARGRTWLDVFSWTPPRYAFAGGLALALALGLSLALLDGRDTHPALGELSTGAAASALFSTTAPAPYSDYRWSERNNSFLFAAGPTEAERAFRVGVHLVDLRVGLEEGRGEDASAALQALRTLGRDPQGNALVSDRWSVLDDALSRGASAERLVAELALLEPELQAALDPVAVDFGRWTEASRLAAAAGNRLYFDVPFFQSVLDEVEDANLASPVLEEVRAIRELTSPASSHALEELESRFRQLILLH